MDFDRKETWFAVISLIAAILLFLFSGFTEIAVIGLVVTVGGILDFLFVGNPLNNDFEDDFHDHGEIGEELWQFRSFIMMVGGPLVILYGIMFH